MIQSVLGRLTAGEDLSLDEMSATIEAVMRGDCSEGEIGLLLTCLREKGESVAEIAGAAAALRKYMVRIPTARQGVLDTCGTGGDGSGTFNISTAAALVAAAAGVPVAKHGNRKITSRTGSADALTALGVNVEASPETVSACLDELGICFCFAPLMHPAMKRVAAVRRQLGFPTIFNFLGPLSNPAGAAYQLLGVGKQDLRRKLAEALSLLGVRRALVVCGDDGLDEVTLGGTTHVSEVAAGRQPREFVWRPEDFGLTPAGRETMLVDGPETSAALIRRILDGEPGPPRDVTVLNAAAGLWTAGRAAAPSECAALAQKAIDGGAAKNLLARLVERTRG